METKQPGGKGEVPGSKPGAGVSKLRLALGAAGLFLFIVGVKRSFRTEEEAPRKEEVEKASAARRGHSREGESEG